MISRSASRPPISCRPTTSASARRRSSATFAIFCGKTIRSRSPRGEKRSLTLKVASVSGIARRLYLPRLGERVPEEGVGAILAHALVPRLVDREAGQLERRVDDAQPEARLELARDPLRRRE